MKTLESPSGMRVRVFKTAPKRTSIERRAQTPVSQVMEVCFILVLGHRYEACTLVFYKGVF